MLFQGAKDAPTPRPNKRPRLDPSQNKDISSQLQASSSNAVEISTPSKSDAQLDEYLKVMQPRTTKGPAWANDAQSEQPAAPVPEPEAVQDTAMDTGEDPAKEEGISDLDWMKQRMTTNADVVEKVFEQSDDEDAAEKPDVLVKPKVSLQH